MVHTLTLSLTFLLLVLKLVPAVHSQDSNCDEYVCEYEVDGQRGGFGIPNGDSPYNGSCGVTSPNAGSSFVLDFKVEEGICFISGMAYWTGSSETCSVYVDPATQYWTMATTSKQSGFICHATCVRNNQAFPPFTLAYTSVYQTPLSTFIGKSEDTQPSGHYQLQNTGLNASKGLCLLSHGRAWHGGGEQIRLGVLQENGHPCYNGNWIVLYVSGQDSQSHAFNCIRSDYWQQNLMVDKSVTGKGSAVVTILQVNIQLEYGFCFIRGGSLYKDGEWCIIYHRFDPTTKSLTWVLNWQSGQDSFRCFISCVSSSTVHTMDLRNTQKSNTNTSIMITSTKVPE